MPEIRSVHSSSTSGSASSGASSSGSTLPATTADSLSSLLSGSKLLNRRNHWSFSLLNFICFSHKGTKRFTFLSPLNRQVFLRLQPDVCWRWDDLLAPCQPLVALRRHPFLGRNVATHQQAEGQLVY